MFESNDKLWLCLHQWLGVVVARSNEMESSCENRPGASDLPWMYKHDWKPISKKEKETLAGKKVVGKTVNMVHFQTITNNMLPTINAQIYYM